MTSGLVSLACARNTFGALFLDTHKRACVCRVRPNTLNGDWGIWNEGMQATTGFRVGIGGCVGGREQTLQGCRQLCKLRLIARLRIQCPATSHSCKLVLIGSTSLPNTLTQELYRNKYHEKYSHNLILIDLSFGELLYNLELELGMYSQLLKCAAYGHMVGTDRSTRLGYHAREAGGLQLSLCNMKAQVHHMITSWAFTSILRIVKYH